jgi:hypothetical protein
MQLGIILLTAGAYGLAIYVGRRDRVPNYLIALLAGHLGALLSPLWQILYGFSYDPRLPALYTLFGHPLPRVNFLAAWTMMLPPLLIFYLYRHRWWFSGYTTGVLTVVLFVLYHLLVEQIGLRAGWWRYTTPLVLPFDLPVPVLAGLMNGLVSLGLLSVLLLTRHYAWTSLLLFLLPVPLVLTLLVHGLLGAPLYAALLLRAQSWAGVIGMLGTLGLLVWGAHIVAGSMDRPRNWRQTI